MGRLLRSETGVSFEVCKRVSFEVCKRGECLDVQKGDSGGLERSRKTSRCRSTTYPESCITEYTTCTKTNRVAVDLGLDVFLLHPKLLA